jgi:hypothetical protein
MIKALENVGGYPMDLFVNEDMKHLTCAICFDVLKDAMIITSCSHGFCKICLLNVIKKESSAECPLCRETFTWDKVIPNRIVDECVQKMVIACPNSKINAGFKKVKGCEWKEKLQELDNHLINHCQHNTTDCTNIGCEEGEVTKQHFLTCEFRTVNCVHCGEARIYRDQQTHYYFCQKFPIKCPYKCRSLNNHKLPRLEMTKHLEDSCDKKVIKCSLYNLGCIPNCKGLIRRRDYINHVGNPVDNFTAAFRKLEEENYILKSNGTCNSMSYLNLMKAISANSFNFCSEQLIKSEWLKGALSPSKKELAEFLTKSICTIYPQYYVAHIASDCEITSDEVLSQFQSFHYCSHHNLFVDFFRDIDIEIDICYNTGSDFVDIAISIVKANSTIDNANSIKMNCDVTLIDFNYPVKLFKLQKYSLFAKSNKIGRCFSIPYEDFIEKCSFHEKRKRFVTSVFAKIMIKN